MTLKHNHCNVSTRKNGVGHCSSAYKLQAALFNLIKSVIVTFKCIFCE